MFATAPTHRDSSVSVHAPAETPSMSKAALA
jgi:hypothetical protein